MVISVPLDAFSEEEYCSDHVEARLGRRHAVALKRLRRGLERDAATLEDGRHVRSNADVVRWLLDQLTPET